MLHKRVACRLVRRTELGAVALLRLALALAAGRGEASDCLSCTYTRATWHTHTDGAQCTVSERVGEQTHMLPC